MVRKLSLLFVVLLASQISALGISDAEDIIENTIKHMADGLKATVKLMEDIFDAIVDKAEKDIQELVDAIKDQVQAAEDNECAKKAAESLEEVARESLDEVIACGTDKIKEAQDIVDKMDEQIDAGVQAIEEAIDAVRACDKVNIIQRPLCISKATAELGLKVTAVTTKLTAQVARAAALIATAKAQMEVCAALKAADALVQVGNIGLAVAQCLID